MQNQSNKQILIATVLSRLSGAIKHAEHAYSNTGISSLISCQTFENIKTPNTQERSPSYEIIYTKSIGLSNNRNNALQASTAKYIWFLDDDVEVIADGCLQAFEELEQGSSDVISTCYVIDGRKTRKNYKKEAFLHNRLSIMKVSSIEIMCNREALIKNAILFDARFGLGAEFKSGEENIFLSDCLNQGLKIMYQPICTSLHPDETSGSNYQDKLQLVSKGAIIRRVYGIWGLPFVVAFFIKRLFQKELSPAKALKASCYGIKGFFKVVSH
ncbi:glycosyltransferase family 2 protein [uncultured Paraglaciecola sp.]|uniref:glycosyltransferase family A protein n=1 Tax=uncultured Paraglaciecola sp. TaxID=1765024 RepID=UPI0025D313DF|nr:glycosyltransferase family 2 protein [uncultured Paraglaciecola sp.]